MMSYATARHYAAKIVEWLAPFCERVEIAGSVRRQRFTCRNVDLVAIPKWKGGTNRLHEHLVKYVEDSGGRAQWQSNVSVPGRTEAPLSTDRNLLLRLPKCELNIRCADQPRFASQWLYYTGSPDHNQFVSRRAATLGGTWQRDQGLYLRNRTGPGFTLVAVQTEEDIYRALDIAWIDPTKREADCLPKD